MVHVRDDLVHFCGLDSFWLLASTMKNFSPSISVPDRSRMVTPSILRARVRSRRLKPGFEAETSRLGHEPDAEDISGCTALITFKSPQVVGDFSISLLESCGISIKEEFLELWVLLECAMSFSCLFPYSSRRRRRRRRY